VISFEQIKIKYVGILLFSILFCTGLLSFGDYWMPVRFSQGFLLDDQAFNKGIHEILLDVEEKIQKGTYDLKDNVPHRIHSDSCDITVIKMTEEKKIIPYTKYRIEIRLRFPYSIMSRSTKLDTILVDTSPDQNHDFADLFWSLQQL
jgi:hypothetical protein